VYRSSYKQSAGAWVLYALYPFLSAATLIGLGIYAITTFDTLTKIVGIGGLFIGVVLFRPKGWGSSPIAVPAQ
jgi:hypothetical protein